MTLESTNHNVIESLNIPKIIREALNKEISEIIESIDTDLVSIILYGSVISSRYIPYSSDINVIFVLKQVTIEILDKISPIIQEGRRKIRLEPFIIISSEIKSSADVFSTKFLDIQKNHSVIYGSDPFKNLEVDKKDVRFRIEQELRNLNLRMRYRYVMAHNDSIDLKNRLLTSLNSVIVQLKYLLELTGSKIPDGYGYIDILQMATKIFNFENDSLEKIYNLKNIKTDKITLMDLYNQFFKNLTTIIKVIDNLESY